MLYIKYNWPTAFTEIKENLYLMNPEPYITCTFDQMREEEIPAIGDDHCWLKLNLPS